MTDLLTQLLDFAINIDQHLMEIVSNYQTWTYLILFAIVFLETGFVVFPFLPGDALLFATGAISALEGSPMNIYTIIILLIVAAFLGDNTNFTIGRFLGHRIYQKNYRWIKREHIDRTHAFYEKHGGKTLILARYMPVVRAFAPFVAGVGEMTYARFLKFSAIGNVLWVTTFCFAGLLFGNIPAIKHNFTLAIIIITVSASSMPVLLSAVKHFVDRHRKRKLSNK